MKEISNQEIEKIKKEKGLYHMGMQELSKQIGRAHV